MAKGGNPFRNTKNKVQSVGWRIWPDFRSANETIVWIFLGGGGGGWRIYGRVKLSWFSLEIKYRLIHIYKVKHKTWATVLKIPNNDWIDLKFVCFTTSRPICKFPSLFARLIVAKLEYVEPTAKLTFTISQAKLYSLTKKKTRIDVYELV